MTKNIEIFAFSDEAGSEIPKQIAAMKRNGLTGSELRGTEFGNISDINRTQAKYIAKRLSDEGLKVWSVGSPLGKIGINDPFGPEIEKLKRTVETAFILGASNIRAFSFYIPGGEEPEKYSSKVIERLSEMAAVTDTLHTGITLCHENEKGIYGDNAERCREILDKVPDIVGVFDPANFVQCGVDTLEAWKLLKDRVRYLHIKDALAEGQVVPAGRGIGHLREIVADYIAMGGMAVTVEPHLTVFSGLTDLERGDKRSHVGETYSYPSADIAFDAACAAIKEIIEEV